MGGRGRERQVHCEKCGRSVRRDKAVYIEKPILQNPLDRNQIAEPSTYRAVLTREVAYCPGCGKHLRVYEKKIKQNIRNDERAARQREFGYQGDRGSGGGGRFPPRRYDRPRDTQTQGEQSQSQETAKTTESESAESAGSQRTEAARESESSEESESPAQA